MGIKHEFFLKNQINCGSDMNSYGENRVLEGKSKLWRNLIKNKNVYMLSEFGPSCKVE